MSPVDINLLVISRSVPPRATGTPSIIANQLSWIDGRFAFVGQRVGEHERRANLGPGWSVYGVPEVRRVGPIPGSEWAYAAPVLMEGLAAVRRHRPCAILLVLAEERFVAAGLALAGITGLPLILYVADLMAEVASPRWAGLPRRLSLALQRTALRRAAFRITNIPAFVPYLRDRFGMDVLLTPNCLPRGLRRHQPRAPAGASTPLIIGFCGNVYWNNAERLRALTGVLPAAHARLVVFSAQPRAELQRLGLALDGVETRFVASPQGLVDELAACDLLFLPFSISDHPEERLVARMAFPTKVLDYLAAGRPILLSCPEEAHLASFFRECGAAEVVTDPSAEALLAAIRRLADDPEARLRLAHSSAQVAQRFSGPESVATLRGVLEACCRNGAGALAGGLST